MTEINRSPGTETAAVPALGAGGAGGSGIIGWLSQIWSALTGTLAVSGPLTEDQLRGLTLVVAQFPSYGQEVRIAAGESFSSSFYSTGKAAIGAAVRGNWTGAVLTVQVCIEPTGTEWFDVFDDAGAEVVCQIAQGQMAMWQGRPIRSPLIRLRSGTSAAPVPQVEACTLVILMA